MTNPRFLRGQSVSTNAFALVLLAVPTGFITGVNAASANGQVGATVVSAIVSQPSVVFVLVPQVINPTPQVITPTPQGIAQNRWVIAPNPQAVTSSPSFITSSAQAIAQSSPSRLRYIMGQSLFDSNTAFGRIGTGVSSLISLINVDSAGVARFSVTGADSTSGFSVQLPILLDNSRTQSTAADSTSLILPTQALSGNGRFAVEVARDPSGPRSDPLSVEVSYN